MDRPTVIIHVENDVIEYESIGDQDINVILINWDNQEKGSCGILKTIERIEAVRNGTTENTWLRLTRTLDRLKRVYYGLKTPSPTEDPDFPGAILQPADLVAFLKRCENAKDD